MIFRNLALVIYLASCKALNKIPNLKFADLENADLENANLEDANLGNANLEDANLGNANLKDANLGNANLRNTNLKDANLKDANLKNAYLRYANLENADLENADLENAYLGNANLKYANLESADLRNTNLSGVKGLCDPSDFMNRNFETMDDGWIVYKRIGKMQTEYSLPEYWEIKPGSVIDEVVNQNSTNECGCGVNFGTFEWCNRNYRHADLWRCLLSWKDGPGIVVPYNTDGKARCSRLTLIEIVKEGSK